MHCLHDQVYVKIWEQETLSNTIHKCVTLTEGAQQVVGKHLPQSQLEFCHLYHQKDRKAPSRHQSRLLHHWNEQVVQVLEEQASPVQDIPKNKRKN